MTDAVALTSVIVSGLVALAVLVLSHRCGREQRRHERQLAQDTRAWQQRADGLLDVVGSARSLIDAIDRPGNLEAVEAFDLERGEYLSTVREHVGVSEVGVRVGDVVERLHKLVPVVEVYGSPACREAFHELRTSLRDSGYDPHAGDRLAGIRRGKAAAVEAKDYRSAATARRLEREVLEAARARLTIRLPDTRARAQRLIDAARADLV